jgi:hypothetical protein
MKTIYLALCFLISFGASATSYTLVNGKAQYTVKHLFKTVKGESSTLKGKMECENTVCEFLVAIPTKSFISSDSNRDLNMQTILEITKYPLITAKGKLPETDLAKISFEVKAMVSFHGIEREYVISMKKMKTLSGQFTLLLEDHKVKRPSLLTVEIENQVPIDFTFDLKE